MPSVPLSPGRVTACWFVLRCLERLDGTATRSNLITVASRSSLRSGGLPLRDGITLAIEGHLVRVQQDCLLLNAASIDALELGDEDEPTPAARRYLVSRLLLITPPTWVIYWQGDPQSLNHILPPNERKVLAGVGLFPPEDPAINISTWAFWNALRRVPLMAETAARRKGLGDAGESLSLAYERERLTKEGRPDLARQIQWLSRDSDAYGFDILSFVGGSSPNASDRLAIEVKTTSLPRTNHLHFFLSAHEWETAQVFGKSYILHAWTRVDPGPPPLARDPGPIVIQPASIASHLPSNPACHEGCRWQTAEVLVANNEVFDG